MSRIGKSPITVPSGVNVAVDDRRVTVTGPKGTLSRDIPGAIELRQEDGTLYVERPDDERQNRALHGLTRSLVNNMVVGRDRRLLARTSRSSASAIAPRRRATAPSSSRSGSAIR